MDTFGMGTFPSGRGMSAERAGATGFGLGLAEFYRLRRESGQRRRRATAPRRATVPRRARTSATGEIATPDMTRLAGMPPDLYRSGFRAERPRWGVPAAEEGATPLPPFGEVVKEEPDLMEKERRAQYQQDLKEKEKALRNAFYDVTPFTDPSDPIAMKKIEPWEKTDEGEIYRGAKLPMFRGWTREQIQREHEDTRRRLQYIRNPEITLQQLQDMPTPFQEVFQQKHAWRQYMPDVFGLQEISGAAARPFAGGLPPLEPRERVAPSAAAPTAERPAARPQPAQPKAAEEPGYMRIELPTGARIFQRENERTVMHPDGTVEVGPAGETPTGIEVPHREERQKSPLIQVGPYKGRFIFGEPGDSLAVEDEESGARVVLPLVLPDQHGREVHLFRTEEGQWMMLPLYMTGIGRGAVIEGASTASELLRRIQGPPPTEPEPPGSPSPGTEVPAGIEPEPEPEPKPEPEIEIPERIKARFGARTEPFVEALVKHLGIESANTFMARNENNVRGLRDMAIKLQRERKQKPTAESAREREVGEGPRPRRLRGLGQYSAMYGGKPPELREREKEAEKPSECMRDLTPKSKALRKLYVQADVAAADELALHEGLRGNLGRVEEINRDTRKRLGEHVEEYLHKVEPSKLEAYKKRGWTTPEQLYTAWEVQREAEWLEAFDDLVKWGEKVETAGDDWTDVPVPEGVPTMLGGIFGGQYHPFRDTRANTELLSKVVNSLEQIIKQPGGREFVSQFGDCWEIPKGTKPVERTYFGEQGGPGIWRETYHPSVGPQAYLSHIRRQIEKYKKMPFRERYGALSGKKTPIEAPWLTLRIAKPLAALRTVAAFDVTETVSTLMMGPEWAAVEPGTVGQAAIVGEKIYEMVALMGWAGAGMKGKGALKGFAKLLTNRFGKTWGPRLLVGSILAGKRAPIPPLQKAVGLRPGESVPEVLAESGLEIGESFLFGMLVGRAPAKSIKHLLGQSAKLYGAGQVLGTGRYMAGQWVKAEECDPLQAGLAGLQTGAALAIFSFAAGYGHLRAMKQPWNILGVKPGASFVEVQKAYRSLAKRLHPDVTRGDPKATARFKEITAAYNMHKIAESIRATQRTYRPEAPKPSEEVTTETVIRHMKTAISMLQKPDPPLMRQVGLPAVGDSVQFTPPDQAAISAIVKSVDWSEGWMRYMVQTPDGKTVPAKPAELQVRDETGTLIEPIMPPEVAEVAAVAEAAPGTYRPTPGEQSKALVRVGDVIDRTKGRVTPQLLHEAIQPIVPAGQTLSRETMDMLLRSSREGVRKARAEGKSYRKWVAERIRTAPDKAIKQWRRLSPERDPNPWEKRLLDAGRSPEAILSRRREMKELFKRAKRDKWPKKRVSREIYGMFAAAPPGRAEPAPAVAEAPVAPVPTAPLPREGEIVAPEPTAAPPGAPERPSAVEVAPAKEIAPTPAEAAPANIEALRTEMEAAIEAGDREKGWAIQTKLRALGADPVEAAPVAKAARAGAPAAPKALAGEQGPPGPPAEGPVERFVWRANREGGQEIGNVEEIRSLDKVYFDQWITQKYPNVDEAELPTYAEWKTEHPSDVISVVKVDDKEWQGAAVGPRDDITPDSVWAKKVESFDLPEARQWRLTADSGKEVAAVLKPVHELTMKEWAEQGADVIEARGRRILERIQAKELPASLETGARQDILTAQHVRKGKISGQFKHEHKDRIERALARGEMVPEHVLAEHGLKAKPAKAPVPAAPAKAAPPKVPRPKPAKAPVKPVAPAKPEVPVEEPKRKVAVDEVNTAVPREELEAKADTLGGAGWIRRGEIHGIHVTQYPERMVKKLSEGANILLTRKGEDLGELGGGLYVSTDPASFIARGRKWDFFWKLSKDQRHKLGEAVLAELEALPDGSLTRNELQTAEKLIKNFAEKNEIDGLILLADQPYNSRFWHPDFLEPLGIRQINMPLALPVRLRGRFAKVDHKLNADEVRQLREQGFDGAFLPGAAGVPAQLAVWNRESVVQFGDFKRTEGKLEVVAARMPTGNPLKPLWEAPAKTKSIMPDGTPFEFREALVRRGDLISSHLSSGDPNPNFPQDFQGRATFTAASAILRANITNAPDFGLLSRKENVAVGSPVCCRPRSFVLVGRNRVSALQMADFSGGKPKLYKDQLNEWAKDKGDKAVKTAKDPDAILVRVLESEIPDVAAFTRAADVPELRPYTIYEQATEDAAKMPEDLYGLSVIEGDETLRAALARQNQVRKAMIEHLFTTEEQVLYASSTAEKLTTEGMNRIERAVLAKSTGMSAPMLQQIFEEHGIFKEGLLRASPAMAEMRARLAKGEVAPEWDLTTDFEAMVQSLREIEKAGMNVETALNQVDAFGKSFVATPRQENLLRLFYAYRSHPKLLGEAFKGYVRDAIGSIGEPVQANLLGTVAPPADNASESLKMLRQKAAEWNRSRFKKKAEERKQHGGLGGMTLQVRYKKTPSKVKEPEAHYGSLTMNPAPEGQQVLGIVPTRFVEMQAAVRKNPLCDDLILDFKGEEWDQMMLVSAAELKAQGTEPGSREWQVCKLNAGDYSYDPDKETFAIEAAGLHFRDPFDSSRWRAVLATSATEAAFVEELVHHIQRKLPKENPALAAQVLRLENRWKDHALQRGIVIPDGLELFAKAMTFNIAGHAAQDPEIAELLQIPRSIGKAFLELMGRRRTGKPNYKPFIGLMEPLRVRLPDKLIHRPPPPGARHPTQKVDLYTAFQIKKPPGPPKDPDIAAMVGGDEPLPDQPLTIELAPEPIKKLLADNRNIFRRPAETILRRVKGVREMFFTLHDFVLRFGEVKRHYPELWKRLMGHFAERNAAVERSDDIVEKAAHKYVQIKTPAGLEMTYAYEDPDYKLPKELAENKDFMAFHHDLTSAFKMYEAEKIKHGLIRAGGFQERMAQEARDKIELLKRNLTKMGYPGERQEVLDLPASKKQQAILDQIAELEDWIKVVKRKEYVPKGVVARAYTAMIIDQGGKPMRQFIGGLTRLSAHFPERKGVRTMKDYVEAGLVKPEQADFRKLLIDHIYDFHWRSSLKSLYDFAHARGFIKPIASDYMREQFARAGWYTGREIGITAPEVRGKMIHPIFARALAELKWRPRFKGPLGRVRRFFGLVKMAQFIKMFFMPQYNVIQHFKSGAAIANPIRSAKLLGDAWWHVHNRTSFYHKLDSLNLYQYPIDVPRAQREEMAIMALRRMSANVPWFINQLEARTGMSWRKGDVTALDILMIGNRFITNFVWPVDRVQRTHSVLTFMEQGFPLEEAVQRAASAHAAYSEISQRFGDWAGLITFVHSFRFLMPREQARTLAEPFRILIDYKAGKKIPPRRSKVAAKRLAFLFLLTFGVDLLMTTFGFEREKFAWKYKKRVFDEKTGKWYEIIIPVNTIANMPIKWGHRILDPGPPWKRGVVPFAYGLRSFFHWEMHPVWRVLVDVFRNRSSFGARREVYDESDSMPVRAAKSAKYMFGQYFRIYGRLMDAAEMGSITMEEAKIHARILRENFSPAVLAGLRIVSYPYVRAPNERLAKWASLQANMEYRHRAGRLKGRYARMRTEIEATYSGASRGRKLEKLERWYSKRGKRLADEKRDWFIWIRKKYLLEEG